MKRIKKIDFNSKFDFPRLIEEELLLDTDINWFGYERLIGYIDKVISSSSQAASLF